MREEPKTRKRLKNIIGDHIIHHLRRYTIVVLLLFIGIILGVIFVNNLADEQKVEIENYLTTFITSLKEGGSIDKIGLLLDSLKNNIGIGILLWFLGCTVIGIPILYLVIAFRGFCLGYTISTVIAILGTGKGSLLIASSMLLQNIFFIPCILALGVSGMKLYESIMKDKRRENIKLEIVRHTLFSLIMIMLLALSSVVEVYGSTNLLQFLIKYI